jgi:hypothetical protein
MRPGGNVPPGLPFLKQMKRLCRDCGTSLKQQVPRTISLKSTLHENHARWFFGVGRGAVMLVSAAALFLR